MSGRFVIHSAVDLRLLAWSAAETDNGWDRMVQRKDRYGHPIRWEDYEDEAAQFGWFIEAIDPEEREFPRFKAWVFEWDEWQQGREAEHLCRELLRDDWIFALLDGCEPDYLLHPG